MSIAIWKLPVGYSADKKNMLISRAAAYRFKIDHYLNDGTKVIPNVSTVMSIIQAFDEFNLPVAVTVDSYVVDEEITTTNI